MSWGKANFVGYENPIEVGCGFSMRDVRVKFIRTLKKIAKSKSLKEFTTWAKENIVVDENRIEEAYNELRK